MFEFFTNIHVDWMGLRKPLTAVSILILLAGLTSAVGRQFTEGGTDAFNLGVDFQGGTVVTAKFRQTTSAPLSRRQGSAIRSFRIRPISRMKC
jgi:preprotein translocase subunit SecF